ncbi:hypothetical protein QYE76_009709 [Lolium multiflorum]|uniref:Reverse transcriptase zinc-binding domain-containing protein n=1 Tax=Lolium multiflorum TaxID=4521 RepID=A0AAD8TVT0_LOLMU|nr:hypothetical protein QYE76_009709 [Lolium multiflorum]
MARIPDDLHPQPLLATESAATEARDSDSSGNRRARRGTWRRCSEIAPGVALGSDPRGFDVKMIWSAHAKLKCKLFGWLALHGKLLTSDMLAIRGWPHDHLYPLCLRALQSSGTWRNLRTMMTLPTIA